MSAPSKPRPNQPCPCGSGKRYKECCALNEQRRRRAAKRARKAGLWIAGAAVVALIGYGASQMSGIVFTEADLRAVDFSALDAGERKQALQAANRARCTCGCGLGLAQCVATDATCPIRESNIQKIQAMVRDAKGSRPSS